MKNQNKSLLLYFSLVFLALFLLILINTASFVSIDNFFSNLALSNQNSFLLEISKFVGAVFQPEILIVVSFILALFFWIKKMRKDALFFAIVMTIGGAFIYILKDIIQRARPLSQIVAETGFSFPSGHALISVIFFGFFIYLAFKYLKMKGKIVLSFIFVFLILFTGFTRIYLNVHWFSDVLGGFFLGAFLLLLCIFLRKSINYS